MNRPISFLANVVLGAVLGCANVAGVGDYKKEGEGGKSIDSECADVSECGAGLACVNNTCLRLCYDPANPGKQCGADSGCFPLVNGTQAVCAATGGQTDGVCSKPTDCAPGYNCLPIGASGEFLCAPYCNDKDLGCAGGNVCRGFSPSVTIDGVGWGVCGPNVSTVGATGGS